MNELNFKYYRTSLLITSILLLGTFLDIGITRIIAQIQDGHSGLEILRIPSNATIIGSLLILIDKFLWKYTPFKWLVSIPDMSGRYQGTITYYYQDKKTSKECVLEIYQTASKIKVNSYFQYNDNEERTTSRSLLENIIKEDNNTFSLLFYYLNEGTKGQDKFDCHEGVNRLSFLVDGKDSCLTGHYFTNRSPQTKGIIDVKWGSKELKHKF